MQSQKQMQSIYIQLPDTTVYEQLYAFIKNTPVVDTPSLPSYTILDSSRKLMDTITGLSDPNVVAYLTALSPDTLNSTLIDFIMNYLIKTQQITQDISVLLVNQIEYAMRFVLQFADDTLIETLITSDNHAPQILQWRTIASIEGINPDIFSTFYQITPDDDLRKLISVAFKSPSAMNSVKSIISCEKKISFDGIYYRITLESTTGNRYLLVFYYIPNKDYNEIYRY
jgi:transcription elongation factor GreA-like protein